MDPTKNPWFLNPHRPRIAPRDLIVGGRYAGWLPGEGLPTQRIWSGVGLYKFQVSEIAVTEHFVVVTTSFGGHFKFRHDEEIFQLGPEE